MVIEETSRHKPEKEKSSDSPKKSRGLDILPGSLQQVNEQAPEQKGKGGITRPYSLGVERDCCKQEGLPEE
jgi:hypothetical protein